MFDYNLLWLTCHKHKIKLICNAAVDIGAWAKSSFNTFILSEKMYRISETSKRTHDHGVMM